MNYVIFTDGFNDMEEVFFDEVKDMTNVRIISKNYVIRNRLLLKLFRIHTSFRINRLLVLPFQFIWYKNIFVNDFAAQDVICFVFSASWFYPNYFNYLRNKFPNSKFVFYFSDTISSKKKNIPQLDITYLKNEFDVVASYNPSDVKKYGIKYVPMCYSKYSHIELLDEVEEIDVLFIGAARDRLASIHDAYNNLNDQNVKCFFYVVSKEYDSLSKCDGIYYSNKPMSYKRYMEYLMRTKCVLEILDSETQGGTLRFWDAVMYNKQLITNNKNIFLSKFYRNDYIHFSENFNDIDANDILGLNQKVEFGYDGENSPVVFLNTIKNFLNLE